MGGLVKCHNRLHTADDDTKVGSLGERGGGTGGMWLLCLTASLGEMGGQQHFV